MVIQVLLILKVMEVQAIVVKWETEYLLSKSVKTQFILYTYVSQML